MTNDTALLGGLSVEAFLRDHWQKRPLRVAAALPDLVCPLTPEELAGLALDEEVESRLITQDGEQGWTVRHGPFVEADLTTLPATHWTLLVQEINKHVPELAQLQEHFAFLPNWRLDDVMVSFAPEGGSVGPHADNYDTFIIQCSGKRRWQVNETPPGPDDLLPDLPLQIMRHFESEQEWTLQPGDMLYLPPGCAHHGVALEDSLSISIGFRAPTHGELLAGFYGETIAGLDTAHFYADPGLERQDNPGAISAQARASIRAIIRNLATDDAAIDHWFGRFITDLRPGHTILEPEQPLKPRQLLEMLHAYDGIERSEYSRYAYIDEGQHRLRLYVAGDEFMLEGAACGLARLLAGQRSLPMALLTPHLDQPGSLELLCELYNLGALYFAEE